MHENPYEKLNRLSGEIEKTEDSYRRYYAAKAQKLGILWGEASPELENLEKEAACANILLRSQRIHVILDLTARGFVSGTEKLAEDWEKIVKSVMTIEEAYAVTGEILSDALHIVLLQDMGNRRALLNRLGLRIRMKIRESRSLREPVVNITLNMLKYCIIHDRLEDMGPMARNLILLSEARNGSHPPVHREVVCSVLWYTVDRLPAFTLSICREQERHFHSDADFDTSRFYWFYGFAMYKEGFCRESMPILRHCSDLCQKFEGDESWIGARSRQLCAMQEIESDEAEAYLWEFLEKIDCAFYDVDYTETELDEQNTRCVLLKKHLERQDMFGMLPQIHRFADYCRRVRNNPPNPLLTVRNAENMLSAYYEGEGELLLGIRHALNALEAKPPENMESFLTDDLIYSNLLMMYSRFNDVDAVLELTDMLSSKLDEYEDDTYHYFRLSMLIQSAYKRIGMSMENLMDDFRESILDFHAGLEEDGEDFFEEDSKLGNIAMSLWVMDLMETVMDSNAAEPRELQCYVEILSFLDNHPHLLRFNHIQRMLIYMQRAQAEWLLKQDSFVDSLETCLRLREGIVQSSDTAIAIARFGAALYSAVACSGPGDCSQHYAQRAVELAKSAISGATEAWQGATSYLNDQRICQAFTTIRANIFLCMSILRNHVDSRELYQQVLCTKDLPALAGRERNRILHLDPVDEALKNRIFQAQNQLAAAQMQDSMNGTDTARDIALQLQKLEADFAEKFPNNVRFTPITFDGVCRKLPEGAAIVEYVFFARVNAESASGAEDSVVALDVFITKKTDGNLTFRHLNLSSDSGLYDGAEQYVELLRKPETASEDQKNALRAKLYRGLIEPVLPHLEQVRNVYIAPDNVLCNIPFEILYAGDSGMLQDRFRVCRIVCGRDLLFFRGDPETAAGCFVLGDPDYEGGTEDGGGAFTRAAVLDYNPVQRLPFSGIEAERVARRCRTTPFTGKAATKFALQKALPCGIIHLATHGIFDDETTLATLYSSQLVFAGYNNWIARKRESEDWGNGILTADEISRLDMHQTELVVLSACQSGVGDVSVGSVQGLLSAFSATGVRWVVSHLWEASDIATPILMDAFYDAYLNLGMDVPDALNHAKEYLRTVTLGELRRNGWFDAIDMLQLSEKANEELKLIRLAPDRRRFFQDEFFWGGFVCHNCNG